MILPPNQIFVTDDNGLTRFVNPVIYNFGRFNIYVHEDYQHRLFIGTNFCVYGDCINPRKQTTDFEEIFEGFESLSLDKKIHFLGGISGYFLAIIWENDQYFVLNDAAAQFEAYFYTGLDKFILASQPILILPFLEEEKRGFRSDAPDYIIENKICIFQFTPFAHIQKVISNYALLIETRTLFRIFPRIYRQEQELKEVCRKAADLLQNSMITFSKKRKLAIPITAGWDSRLILAASKDIPESVAFTYLHGDVQSALDNKIGKELCLKLEVQHRSINTSEVYLKPQSWVEQAVWKYENGHHKITQIFNQHFPEHYYVNGNISEIARNRYGSIPKNVSAFDLCYLLKLNFGKYEKQILEYWLREAKKITHFGYNLIDFLLWENKFANSIAATKSLCNLQTNMISPYNNRDLQTLLLSSKSKYRDLHLNTLYEEIVSILAPEIAQIPVNPSKNELRVTFFKRIGVYNIYRKTFFILRRTRFVRFLKQFRNK